MNIEVKIDLPINFHINEYHKIDLPINFFMSISLFTIGDVKERHVGLGTHLRQTQPQGDSLKNQFQLALSITDDVQLLKHVICKIKKVLVG